MPFKSDSQRGYLYANHPEVAEKFERHTPKGKKRTTRKLKHDACADRSTRGRRGRR